MKNSQLLRSIVVSLSLLSFAQLADARDRKYIDTDITEGWRLLDCGQRYKETWVNEREQQGLGKTYAELLASLNTVPVGTGCTDTNAESGQRLSHQGFLNNAALKFSAAMQSKTGDSLEQAKWGLQESFSLMSEAHLVKGNDLLLNGLRSRFKAEPESKSQIEMLGDSVAEFQVGLKNGLPLLMDHSADIRRAGEINAHFPFLVANTEGPISNNEYMQFTELLNRYGIAAISEAKYFYYKNNIKDIDNPPFNNFPGVEDLDFNGDNIENEAGRIEASKRAKTAASNLYLQGVLLAAEQEPNTFQTNNGYQLKRQLNEADRLYLDIQNGFNPLKLAGDFMPYQRVENFLQLARARVNDASSAENAAVASKRTFETDSTALASELRSQTQQYLNQMEELTGLPSTNYDLQELVTREGRAQYKADAHEYAEVQKKGQIGVQYISIEESMLQVKGIHLQIAQIPKRIGNEEQRNGRSTSLILSTGKKISAMQLAVGVANQFHYIANGFGSGVTFNPGAIVQAISNASTNMAQAIQSAKLDDFNSEATIKNLLLEQDILSVSLQQIQKDVERQKAIVDTQWANLDRILANYAVAQEDLAEAYFSNPAYRMEASRAEQTAEDTFETALELSYYAAKALEYQWSEKFNNPVLRLDGGLPEPLAVSFDAFMRAESIFGAQFADRHEPSLDGFLDAMQAWDVKMRQLRYPERQIATVRFSLRDDLLGLGEYSPEVAEAKFRSMVDKSRYLGENTANPDMKMNFTLDILDESLFPAHPNIKIENIKANLVSTASRSIRGSSNMAPALVDVVLLDRANVRTFFAEYPARDDLLSYQLQSGRTLEGSPFIATVEASIDGYASPVASANTQLANHSPAVSTWVLRFKNNRYNNRDLKLEYLADVEFEIQYSFGKPRDFSFPASN